MWPVFVAGESEAAIHKILVDGSDAVVLGRIAHTVKANGRRFSTPVAFHFTVENARPGKTVGDGYGDWSLAIYVQPTFDTIAAATAALDPARRHRAGAARRPRLPRFFPLS